MESWDESPSSFHTNICNFLHIKIIFFGTSSQRHKVDRTVQTCFTIFINNPTSLINISPISNNKFRISLPATVLYSLATPLNSIAQFSTNGLRRTRPAVILSLLSGYSYKSLCKCCVVFVSTVTFFKSPIRECSNNCTYNRCHANNGFAASKY